MGIIRRLPPRAKWVGVGGIGFVAGFIVGLLMALTGWSYEMELEKKVSVGTLLEILTTLIFVVGLTLYFSRFFALDSKIKAIFVSRCDRLLSELEGCNARIQSVRSISDESKRREIISVVHGTANSIHTAILQLKASWEAANLPELDFSGVSEAARLFYMTIGDNDQLYLQVHPNGLTNTIQRVTSDFRNALHDLQVALIKV